MEVLYEQGSAYMGFGYTVQGSAKRWALGCVNTPLTDRQNQETGFTQPRALLLADPCIATYMG